MENNVNCLKNINTQISSPRIDFVYMLGLFNYLIISKDWFQRNAEVAEMITGVLGVELPQYVIASRTLMAARVSRLLYVRDEDDLKIVLMNLKYKLENQTKDSKNEDYHTVKKGKKKNENEKLEKWLNKL